MTGWQSFDRSSAGRRRSHCQGRLGKAESQPVEEQASFSTGAGPSRQAEEVACIDSSSSEVQVEECERLVQDLSSEAVFPEPEQIFEKEGRREHRGRSIDDIQSRRTAEGSGSSCCPEEEIQVKGEARSDPEAFSHASPCSEAGSRGGEEGGADGSAAEESPPQSQEEGDAGKEEDHRGSEDQKRRITSAAEISKAEAWQAAAAGDTPVKDGRLLRPMRLGPDGLVPSAYRPGPDPELLEDHRLSPELEADLLEWAKAVAERGATPDWRNSVYEQYQQIVAQSAFRVPEGILQAALSAPTALGQDHRSQVRTQRRSWDIFEEDVREISYPYLGASSPRRT